jgi:hypothetical protein
MVCVDVVVLVLLAKQQQKQIVNLFTISVCYVWALATLRKKSQTNIFFIFQAYLFCLYTRCIIKYSINFE